MAKKIVNMRLDDDARGCLARLCAADGVSQAVLFSRLLFAEEARRSDAAGVTTAKAPAKKPAGHDPGDPVDRFLSPHQKETLGFTSSTTRRQTVPKPGWKK